MPFVPAVEGVQDAVRLVLRELLSESAPRVKPRGIATRELLGAAVTIANPRDRLVVRPDAKRWSLAFAMAEFLWYMRGEGSVDTMAFYAPSMRALSDDGETLNSAYGQRIFGGHPGVGFDQWQAVKRLLAEDPDSRQAVIHIRVPGDALLATKDHPCTVALQFLRRDGRLHMVTTMRSNDVIVGTTYDIFSFTMMQEQMALELGVELGRYHHHVGSWHLYESQLEVAEELLESTARPAPMPPLEPGLEAMVADEERIRRGHRVEPGSGYWRDWRVALSAFAGLGDGAPRLAAPYAEVWELGRQKRATAP